MPRPDSLSLLLLHSQYRKYCSYPDDKPFAIFQLMDSTHRDPSMHVFACLADWLNVRMMLLSKAERLDPTGSFPMQFFRASKFEEHVKALEMITSANYDESFCQLIRIPVGRKSIASGSLPCY